MASRRSCPVPVRSEELHRIIQEELSRGIFKPKSKQEMCPSSNRGIAETRGARNRSGMHRISVNNQAIGCLRTCVRHHTSALTDGGGFSFSASRAWPVFDRTTGGRSGRGDSLNVGPIWVR